MPSTARPHTRPEPVSHATLHQLLNDETLSVSQKCEYVQNTRDAAGADSRFVDMMLVKIISQYRGKLREASALQAQIEDVYKDLEKAYKRLTAPPLYPATFLESRTIGSAATALVHYNNSPRFVTISDEFDAASVQAGQEVLLSSDRNLLVDKLDGSPLNRGETVVFDRYTEDGRLVVKRRDEEFVAGASAVLQDVELKKGDTLRWNPSAWIAYEKVERPGGGQYFLEESIDVTFDDIGGLDKEIEEMKNLVLLHLKHVGTTQRYGLAPERAALLEGPPGTGKTMLVKAMVSFLRTLSPTGEARFIDIKPGELASMWYGQSEANIREVFRVAREASVAQPEIPVVMFLDELDSIAASRGASLHRVDDRQVTALAAEINGLQACGNVLILAATNRKDILDEALIRAGRFGDVCLKVGRPRRPAARAILSKYLRDDMPYATEPGANSAGANGGSDETARAEILDAALSRLYSPNGDGDVATLTFRDGTRRTVRINELMSGAVLAKIARVAARRACLREIETGAVGIELNDVLAAVCGEVDTAARLLTPANCTRFLDDLPQDVDVVRVEPVERKPADVYRYIQAS
jgi:proteasome-associated ATPase